MRLSKKSKSFRLAGPLLALAVLATFTAFTLSAQEPLAPTAPAVTAPAAAADTPVASTESASAATQGGALPDAVIPMEPREGAGVESLDDKNLINVTVENETLENVVNMFARISGANIVTTSSDLGGTVTVNLRGVEWKPALASILDVHNLALVEKLPGSDVYTIIPKPAAEDAPLVVETVFLNFTTVAEMGPMARSMLGTASNTAVTEFPSRNAMVIKTTEPNMREIRALIKEMDVPGRQVVVEAKFMELTDGASKKLGIRWDSLDAYRVGLTPTYGYEKTIDRNDTRDNSIGHSDSRTQSRSSQEGTSLDDTSTKLFDRNGNQIEDVTYTLFDPNPNVDGDEQVLQKVVPTRQAIDSITAADNQSDSRTITDTTVNNIADTFAKSVSQAQSAILDFDAFHAVISALERTDGVSVISNPKLIVASGSKDAYFTVGDREPLIRTEVQRGTQDSPGDTITAELDTKIQTEYIKQGYLETGIHLQVIPVVKTDDLIEAGIEPKLVRRILPDKVVGNNSWPRIAVKEIKTTFTLRSGQTVAIGGLTDTSDEKQTTKIPLLGDIPLLGKYLFSHTADVRRQVETIIFVTLSLADAENLYREAGIPEDARLVHKRLIKNGSERDRFDNELEQLRKAADEEKKAEAAAAAAEPKKSKTKGAKRHR